MSEAADAAGPDPPDRADAALLETLDDGFARIRRLAGEHLSCHAGCDACCHGPFPITRLDARRLSRGLGLLRRSAPRRAARIRSRAARAVEVLVRDFPGDPGSGRLVQDEARLDPFFARHAALACPALDPADGTCELYRWRPVSCRTYGPPARFGPIDSPPCSLCFTGATAEEIDACRYEPDPQGLERLLLAEIGVRADDDWETLIPFALGRGTDGETR